MIKNILIITLAGATVFYIGSHQSPENHGYAKQDIAALNDYLATDSGPIPKYKWSTMADIDALFPSELPPVKRSKSQ